MFRPLNDSPAAPNATLDVSPVPSRLPPLVNRRRRWGEIGALFWFRRSDLFLRSASNGGYFQGAETRFRTKWLPTPPTVPKMVFKPHLRFGALSGLRSKDSRFWPEDTVLIHTLLALDALCFLPTMSNGDTMSNEMSNPPVRIPKRIDVPFLKREKQFTILAHPVHVPSNPTRCPSPATPA